MTRPFRLWAGQPSPAPAVRWARRYGRPAWLFGGALRDLLLGRAPRDWDLVVAGPAAVASQSLAASVKGSVFKLSEGFQQYRVIFRFSRKSFHYDIQSLNSQSLEEFLSQRDFTINALARPLAPGGDLIDLHHGLDDLFKHRLRALTGALAADPVRAFRGLRLAAELNLKIAPVQLNAVMAMADKAKACTPERRRDELFRTLELHPKQGRFVRLALELAFGRDSGRALRLQRLGMRPQGPDCGGRSRRALLIFAAALKEQHAEIGRSWRLSRMEIRFLKAWQQVSNRTWKTGEDWLAALWQERESAVDLNHLAKSAGSAGLRQLARRCVAPVERLSSIKPWLDGREASRLSGLSGPRLGRRLAQLAALQAMGKMRSRSQAKAWMSSAAGEAAGR